MMPSLLDDRYGNTDTITQRARGNTGCIQRTDPDREFSPAEPFPICIYLVVCLEEVNT